MDAPWASCEPSASPPARASRAEAAANGRGAERLRRIADIAVSLFILCATAPLMLVLAVLIRLDSSGPALFRQIRIGKNRRRVARVHEGPERRKDNLGGQPFAFYKFRTMYFDARERFPELYTYRFNDNEVRTLQFKLPDDPRHTRLGRWLRKTSLDELPNFWNVLKGDMTLVGPRPDIPEMTQYYRPNQMSIFEVKPGLTGYAQINGRCALKFHATKELDARYVRERSLAVDARVLMRTVVSVVTARGAF